MANANRRPAAIFRTLAAVSQRHKDAKQDDPTSFNHEAVARAWESAKPKPATFVPSDASVAPPQANIGVAN
jgi:hypothetical protein